MGERQKKQVIKGTDLRSFGFIMGGILLGIALWPMVWRAEDPYWIGIGISAALMFSALVFPKCLRPLFCVWMKIGAVLGWVNTRIILSIGFYVIFTPIGLCLRVLGRDPLGLRAKNSLPSYRVVRVPRSPTHMHQQF